jgi:hypothetical protein
VGEDEAVGVGEQKRIARNGTGVQLYLLAPVRLRDVILAKNIASLTLLGVEAALAWCVAALPEAVPLSKTGLRQA